MTNKGPFVDQEEAYLRKNPQGQMTSLGDVMRRSADEQEH